MSLGSLHCSSTWLGLGLGSSLALGLGLGLGIGLVRTREGTAKVKALRRNSLLGRRLWRNTAWGRLWRGGWVRAVSSAATPRDARLALRRSRVALRASKGL